jgi:hypothetical protein
LKVITNGTVDHRIYKNCKSIPFQKLNLVNHINKKKIMISQQNKTKTQKTNKQTNKKENPTYNFAKLRNIATRIPLIRPCLYWRF